MNSHTGIVKYSLHITLEVMQSVVFWSMFLHACSVHNSKEKGRMSSRLIYLYACALCLNTKDSKRKVRSCKFEMMQLEAVVRAVVLFLIIYPCSYNYLLSAYPYYHAALRVALQSFIKAGFSKFICS